MNTNDEINLLNIFKKLLQSRLQIILVTIVFTFLGFLYSMQLSPSYKSNALIEIGQFINNRGEIKPIESTSELIKNIKIDLIYKRPELNLSSAKFNSIEEKLIDISIISLSSKSNQIGLNHVVNYVLERHSNLIDSRKFRLETEIKSFNDEIQRINDELISRKNAVIYEKELQINKLKNQLPIIDKKIKVLNQIIFVDSQNLELIKTNSDIRIQRAAQVPTLDQVISSYKTQLINNEEEKSLINLEIENLENLLKLINDENSYSSFNSDIYILTDKRFKLLQDKIVLEDSLKLLANNKINESKIITETSATIIPPNRTVYIVLGFLFGLFLSFTLVLISPYIRAIKDN